MLKKMNRKRIKNKKPSVLKMGLRNSPMQVQITKLPQSEIELNIKIPAEQWQEFLDEAARKLSHEFKIEGFRPGHAPLELVEGKIGTAKILEEAAQHCIQKCYVRAVMENNIEALGRPEISVLKMARGNPFEFKAKAAVIPEVTLADYRDIARNEPQNRKENIKTEDKEIENALHWLQKSRAKFLTVRRPAQRGDRVEIDFSAKENGQLIKNGASQNHPLILGQDRLVPGFEENLVGLKEGEEKKFSLVFPENFPAKELAGRLADFEVKMKLVQEIQLPSLTDAFAQSLGNFKDLTHLQQSIAKGLEQEKQQKEKDIWRAKVLEKIAAASQMDTPPFLIQAELEKMIQEFKTELGTMGLDFQTYIDNLQKTEEELKRDWRDKAKRQVCSALTLRAIAKKENIEAAEQEIEEETNSFLARYPDTKSASKKIDIENLKGYTKTRLENEKVFQFLESL